VSVVLALTLPLFIGPVKADEAAPVVSTSPLEAPIRSEPRWRRRLVLTNFYALNLSAVFVVPSLDLSLFVGRSVGRLAFGYQATVSVGGADLPPLLVVPLPPQDPGFAEETIALSPPLLYHRHHLTMVGHVGRRGRIFYSVGGGPWWVAGWRIVGAEAEVRTGYRFRVLPGRRRSGVVGGQVRLGGAFRGVPLPAFGIFVGLAVL